MPKTSVVDRPSTIYGEPRDPVEVPIKYCLYARKSTEQDELQALSIDSQIHEMTTLAKKEGLDVIEIRKESHSAKESNQRPVFNKMITDLREGMFNGILTWAPDRLSRNAGDLGALVDLMDRDILVKIRTVNQFFTNSPNEKFMLMILCSQAKLENDNKSLNVKRGLKAKCQMGYRPGVTPLGYVNEPSGIKGQRKVMIDPSRAPVIKKMFEKVAYEGASGREICRWLVYDQDFKTKSGKRAALGRIFVMLHSPFYYGEFEYPQGSGTWYKGNHEPIITKEIFEQVQENLKVDPKMKYGIKDFQFTKLVFCGTCGGMITADEKFKKLLDGGVRRHVYYRCTKKIDMECQEPPITEEALLEQMIKLMDKIDFNKKGTFDKIKQEVERYNKFSQVVFGKNNKDKEITLKKAEIKSYAKYVLREGSREEKRELLMNLRTKLYIKDSKIFIKEDEQKDEVILDNLSISK